MNELANYLDRLITALERLADAADRDRPRVLDPDGAAKLMGVGVTRVMALARTGELPNYREGHGTRFLSSDVEHYIREKRFRLPERLERALEDTR